MVSFFRWRTNRYGTEQFWHGVLDHHGEPKRRYEELAQFAGEMATLNEKAGDSAPPADYALIYDYDALWSYEIQPQVTSGFGYIEFASGIVNALAHLGLSVDIVPPEADLSVYPMVICPSLHVSSESRARSLREYVQSGGRLVLGPRSGVRDMENAIVNDVLPGTLRELVGAEVPEYDMFSGAPDTRVFVVSADGEEYEAFGMADLLESAGGAESVLTYKGRYYTGRTAATRHALGNGACYYLGTALGADGLRAFLSPIAREAGISPAPEPPATVEITRRVGNGSVFRFYLNHSATAQQVTAIAGGTDVHTGQSSKEGESITLEPFDVRVIQEST
jgi:beta-galactosidase